MWGYASSNMDTTQTYTALNERRKPIFLFTTEREPYSSPRPPRIPQHQQQQSIVSRNTIIIIITTTIIIIIIITSWRRNQWRLQRTTWAKRPYILNSLKWSECVGHIYILVCIVDLYISRTLVARALYST